MGVVMKRKIASLRSTRNRAGNVKGTNVFPYDCASKTFLNNLGSGFDELKHLIKKPVN